MKKFKSKLLIAIKDKHGNMFPVIICFVFASLVLIFTIFQIGLIYAVANNVNQEAQEAVTSTVQDSYPATYSGLRENETNSYTSDGDGGYSQSDYLTEISQDLQTDLSLDSNLEKKDSSGNVMYWISNMQITRNSLSDSTSNLSETFSFTLSIPTFFGKYFVFNVPMTVYGGYSPQVTQNN